jgi:hypothetical protein
MIELSKLEYIEVPAQKAISRFGILKTSSGAFNMPCSCPSIRTETDAKAIILNSKRGMVLQSIILHLSYRQRFLPTLHDYLGLSYDTPVVRVKGPLVVSDPESEALSFSCTARNNYAAQDNIPTVVKDLLKTGLSKDDKAKGRINVHSKWKEIRTSYGLTSLKEWMVSNHKAVGADVFLAPGPIIRSDVDTIKEAFACGYAILDEARLDFHMSGLHLLIHGELFRDTDDAEIARKAIYSEIDTWSTIKEQYSGKVLSFKLHDPSKILLEPESGSQARRNLSEFVTELSERVRKSKGALIGQNFSNLVLGILDSGADIASFRSSGPMQIDTPIYNSKKKKGSKQDVTSIMDHRRLSMVKTSDVRVAFETTGSYPVPSCVDPVPYWELRDLKDKRIHRSRIECGALAQIGDEYRAAGIDSEIPLKESLSSLVGDSDERQMLIDLCPTLSR